MKNRIESLDALRGIGAFVVVIFHCLISFEIFYQATNVAVYDNDFIKWLSISPLHTFWAGREAVILFFVLSGFVLAIPFLNNTVVSYKDYIIKRFFRIYVPYITVMMLSVLFVSIFADFKNIDYLSTSYNNRWDHSVSLKAIISYFLMLPHDISNVNGVVWSLFHEMRISIIFPLIMFIVLKFDWKKSIFFGFGIFIIAKLICDIASKFIGNDAISSVFLSFGTTFYYALFFVLGSVLSKYRTQVVQRIKKTSKQSKLSLFVTSLLLINCKWMLYIYNFNDTFLTEFIPAFGILILFIVVLSSKLANKVLTMKPLLWMGKISYSLYLTHIITIMMLTIFIGKVVPIEIGFILAPFVALPVAHLSYKYIEAPSIILGKKTIKLVNGIMRRKEVDVVDVKEAK